jgi:hypothetical protein
MSPFLAPELTGKTLSSLLRSPEHERFAIATLVFMLLHPGKAPYSHQGGADPTENVRKQHFPYPLGDRHGKGAPRGPWRFMWSHLPRYMKAAFHRVFADNDRLTVTQWLELLGRYQSDLCKGYVSAEPFPTDFKKLTKDQILKKGGHWKTCTECNAGFGTFIEDHTKCRSCFQQLSATWLKNKPATLKKTKPAGQSINVRSRAGRTVFPFSIKFF